MVHDDDAPAESYEQARDELVAIVAKLEAGTATLEESVGLWERGERLAAYCQDILDGVQDRIASSSDVDSVPGDEADAGVIGIITTDQES